LGFVRLIVIAYSKKELDEDRVAKMRVENCVLTANSYSAGFGQRSQEKLLAG
jgi:hypothetical protein